MNRARLTLAATLVGAALLLLAILLGMSGLLAVSRVCRQSGSGSGVRL